MISSFFVAGIESALMTLEATNVIMMRLQMISKGNEKGQREAELMVTEKVEAFAKARSDFLDGVSNAVIRANLRSIVQANELRLSALQSSGAVPA
jgi:hypothetical protein